jgi:hypothetical protein
MSTYFWVAASRQIAFVAGLEHLFSSFVFVGLYLYGGEGGALLPGFEDTGGLTVYIENIVCATVPGFQWECADGRALFCMDRCRLVNRLFLTFDRIRDDPPIGPSGVGKAAHTHDAAVKSGGLFHRGRTSDG